MRLIDADALVFEYGGLAKIHPSDGYAIAEYFANQVKAMPTIEPEPHWISCSARLPDKYGTYLVTVKGVVRDRIITILEYGEPSIPINEGDGCDWYLCDSEGEFYYDGVLAWTELPEPYKGEANE